MGIEINVRFGASAHLLQEANRAADRLRADKDNGVHRIYIADAVLVVDKVGADKSVSLMGRIGEAAFATTVQHRQWSVVWNVFENVIAPKFKVSDQFFP